MREKTVTVMNVGIAPHIDEKAPTRWRSVWEGSPCARLDGPTSH